MTPLLTEEIELFRPGTQPGWRKIDGPLPYRTPHLQVEEARYTTPGRPGEEVPWIVAHRKPAVAIAPRLAGGDFLLIQQERLPVQQTLWEFPAGQIDLVSEEVTTESIVETAVQELREEAGVALDPSSGRFQPLGFFLPSQGFTTEHVYLLTAQPVCVVNAPQPEDSEHISAVRQVSAGELRRMIAANEITNALTLALFARMAARGLI